MKVYKLKNYSVIINRLLELEAVTKTEIANVISIIVRF